MLEKPKRETEKKIVISDDRVYAKGKAAKKGLDKSKVKETKDKPKAKENTKPEAKEPTKDVTTKSNNVQKTKKPWKAHHNRTPLPYQQQFYQQPLGLYQQPQYNYQYQQPVFTYEQPVMKPNPGALVYQDLNKPPPQLQTSSVSQPLQMWP